MSDRVRQTVEVLKLRAQEMRRDVHALYLVGQDPRVPWYVKVLAVAVAAYALSPVDLIPDFIPVLGYLDDAIIIPAGVCLVIRLIPANLMAEFRKRADETIAYPVSRIVILAIVCLWAACIALGIVSGYGYFTDGNEIASNRKV
tara:strand:- start:5587 stop:6018 length:432 start_codon:yes stop_codon:yes gene_type:complete